jgi:hypothetical protein
LPGKANVILLSLLKRIVFPATFLQQISRASRYRVQHLIEERGRNAKLIGWLDEITADCPKKQAHNMNDPCGARFPDLPKVL